MPESVMIVCGCCHTSNEVVPRETVSLFGGTVPIFDPSNCTNPDCRHFLQANPDEWAAIISVLAKDVNGVPDRWWRDYAKRSAPAPSTA